MRCIRLLCGLWRLFVWARKWSCATPYSVDLSSLRHWACYVRNCCWILWETTTSYEHDRQPDPYHIDWWHRRFIEGVAAPCVITNTGAALTVSERVFDWAHSIAITIQMIGDYLSHSKSHLAMQLIPKVWVNVVPLHYFRLLPTYFYMEVYKDENTDSTGE